MFYFNTLISFYSSSPVPSLRILIPLIVGILFADHYNAETLLGHQLEYTWFTAAIILISLASFALLAFIFYKKSSPFVIGLRSIFTFGMGSILICFSGYLLHHSTQQTQNELAKAIRLQNENIEILAIKKQHHKQIQFETEVLGVATMCILDKNEGFFYKTGDRVHIKNSVLKPLKPKVFNYHHYLKKQGIEQLCIVQCREVALISSGSSFTSHFEKLKYLLINKIFLAAGDQKDEAAGLIIALSLGDKSFLHSSIKEEFKLAGAMHILAISGLHIGILYFGLNLILKVVFRNRKWIQLAGISIILVSYGLLAGFSPSVLRAVIMCMLIHLAMVKQQTAVSINILIFTAILAITFDVSVLWSLGFQLSYLATFSILIFMSRTKKQKILLLTTANERSKFNNIKKWLRKKVIPYFSISFYASVGTFPILLYHFGSFPLSTLISGIVAIPLCAALIYSTAGAYLLSWNQEVFNATFEIPLYLGKMLISSMSFFAEHLNITLQCQIDMIDMITCYIIIFLILLIWKSYQLRFALISLLSILFIVLS